MTIAIHIKASLFVAVEGAVIGSVRLDPMVITDVPTAHHADSLLTTIYYAAALTNLPVRMQRVQKRNVRTAPAIFTRMLLRFGSQRLRVLLLACETLFP